MVLRVLTARATQQVLMELQEVDIFVCQWLNNFAADNPPTTGNKVRGGRDRQSLCTWAVAAN